MTKWEEAAQYVRTAAARENAPLPETAIVFGSGLGYLVADMTERLCLPYRDIPHFPVSTVASHAGVMVIGHLSGTPLIAMSGRSHYYEGYGFDDVAFYVRVLSLLGVKTLILTNAAGGVNRSFAVGDLMLITDHIKFCAESPCRGADDGTFGNRFFDMTNAYTPRLRELARRCAEDTSCSLREGVYFYMSGPQFETPAEINAIRILGGDAVGMSTVPEAIEAAHCGMEVLGISCITNMAAGVLPDTVLSDDDVVEAAKVCANTFIDLVHEIIRRNGHAV